jgi:6-phosphogluconolactonase
VKRFIRIIPVFLILLTQVNFLFAQKNKTVNLVLGTFYDEGVQVYEFNTETGDVQLRNKMKTPGAVFIAATKDYKHLYTVSQESGAAFVNAYEFNPQTAELKLLNKMSSKGAGPSYITLDEKEKFVFVPHYNSGNTTVLPVLKDGTVGEAVQVIQHTGKGPHPQRQTTPHTHSGVFTPDRKYLMVGDLGIDKIMMFTFDPSAKEPLTPAPVPFIDEKPGGGTRVMIVHPNKKFIYSIQEITADVTAYSYQDGVLTPLQTLSLVNPETGNVGSAADVQVSPDGKFLYASNRGDVNELIVFAIDTKTGKLEYKSRQSTLGRTPRYIVIDPTGNYVLASNMGQGNGGRRGAPADGTPPPPPPLSTVTIFKRDKTTGQLTDTGKKIDVSQPGFMMFVPK